MTLQLKRIRVQLAHFSLEVDLELKGRITAIFGPSGAGKTSLLDLIAGLRNANSAFIRLGDRVLTDSSNNILIPTQERKMGYVPQDLSLFPHMTVLKNVVYGHNSKHQSNPLFQFENIIGLLEIQHLLDRGVTALSGGEKQRVALARALLSAPQLLLLDEPLASLDSNLKARIIPYLLRIRDELHLPMLYVTHDQSEATMLADEIILLENGQVTRKCSATIAFNSSNESKNC
ncbi:MAG: molybdenum transporter ATP-binding protein [Verrucomicrobiales bacterium]|nr:molybdenum transporter ATP-binding protein [Verrucomicrobiales bacterium]